MKAFLLFALLFCSVSFAETEADEPANGPIAIQEKAKFKAWMETLKASALPTKSDPKKKCPDLPTHSACFERFVKANPVESSSQLTTLLVAASSVGLVDFKDRKPTPEASQLIKAGNILTVLENTQFANFSILKAASPTPGLATEKESLKAKEQMKFLRIRDRALKEIDNEIAISEKHFPQAQGLRDAVKARQKALETSPAPFKSEVSPASPPKPSSKDELRASGDAAFDKGDLGAATKHYYELLELDIKAKGIKPKLALIMLNGGNAQMAQTLIKEEEFDNPGTGEAAWVKAIFREAEGKDAAADFKKAEAGLKDETFKKYVARNTRAALVTEAKKAPAPKK